MDGCAVDKSGLEQRSSDSVGVCVGLSCLGKTYSLPAALNVYLWDLSYWQAVYGRITDPVQAGAEIPRAQNSSSAVPPSLSQAETRMTEREMWQQEEWFWDIRWREVGVISLIYNQIKSRHVSVLVGLVQQCWCLWAPMGFRHEVMLQ